MMCPECGGDTKIIDSRYGIDDLRCRRRECLECGRRFSTVEVGMDLYLSEFRQPDREAIWSAIEKAVAILKTDVRNALEDKYG